MFHIHLYCGRGPYLILRLQIAIDSAFFPEGTSGKQLDVLARKALWKDGLNYMVGISFFPYPASTPINHIGYS